MSYISGVPPQESMSGTGAGIIMVTTTLFDCDVSGGTVDDADGADYATALLLGRPPPNIPAATWVLAIDWPRGMEAASLCPESTSKYYDTGTDKEYDAACFEVNANYSVGEVQCIEPYLPALKANTIQ